jgi:plasmid stabilization system protein ParE
MFFYANYHLLSKSGSTEYDFNQIREVIEGSYRIIYHIKSDQVDVLAVIHGAMNILHYSEEADD